MTLGDRLRSLIVIAFLGAGISPAAAKTVEVVPTVAVLRYDGNLPKGPAAIPIEATNKKAAYDLSIYPDFDIHHRLIVLTLMLCRPNKQIDGENLLYDNMNWHGLQPFIFDASDLAFGARKSSYGERRIIYIKGLDLEVQIDVTNAVTRLIPEMAGDDANYRFEALDLKIAVRNIRSR